MVESNQKSYKYMENILQRINSKFISLPKEETKRNMCILKQVINLIINNIKAKRIRPKYKRIFFGGSYYDGLKVGKAEEYDLDFIFDLRHCNPIIQASFIHGFVHICIEKPSALQILKEKSRCRPVSSTYLSTSTILNWFEQIIIKVLKPFKKENGYQYQFSVILDDIPQKIEGTLIKSFPAFTLKLCMDKNVYMDIDLVPCFEFSEEQWPKEGYRTNPCPEKGNFLVVPKVPHKDENDTNSVDHYWRLSFQEQERELITGNQFNTMKAVIRLMKKLRDYNHHKIASYFIKTVFLWEIEKRPQQFWSQPLSSIFMEMLNSYNELLKKKNIPYYWNENYNLIGHLKDSTVADISNFISRVIESVNTKNDSLTIARFMLSPEDLKALQEDIAHTTRHRLNFGK